MNYNIRPFISSENSDYHVLFDEIMNFSIEELNDILSTMKKVLSGEIEKSSFSQNLAVVNYDVKNASITQFDELIGHESTIDIYTMLFEFSNALKCVKT